MTRKAYLSGAAIGAVAIVLAGAGGYMTRASAEAGGAVNARPAPIAPSGAPASFADIVEQVAPAVVSVDIEGKATPISLSGPDDSDGSDDGGGAPQLPPGFDFKKLFPPGQDGAPAPKLRASGSGFFISRDGYIVTNNHVIEHADKITIHTKDDRTLTARVIGRDDDTDLAVIKVEGNDFPYVSFEDRGTPRVGDWVVAVGNPFGLGGTATAGIVSALGRPNVSGSSFVDFMQIDAPINRGNSGGPTFDMYGRVVGVNTAIFSPTGGSVGIGFDIPADVASNVARQLIAGGKVTRGYIGAHIQDLTPEIADSLGRSSHKGALIADVTPGGPSVKAGLKAGDLVTQVNGHEVASASDLTRQVAVAKAGDDIRLGIVREGKTQELIVRSGTRPTAAMLALNDGQTVPGAGPGDQVPAQRVLGMRLSPNAKGGVSIDAVRQSSDAADKGLQGGDVILQAGQVKTNSPAEVASAVADAKKAGHKQVLLLVARNGRQAFIPIQIDAEAEASKG